MKTPHFILILLLFFLGGIIAFSQDLPAGGNVVSGSATISVDGSTMNINQQSQNASIDFDSYNIGAQNTVNYIQPNTNSIAFNRVTSQDPSTILGSLNANGIIYLLNPNGILFGESATINVGGLVAAAFMDDTVDLENKEAFLDGASGTVTNRGQIVAESFAVLAGQEVDNSGSINSAHAALIAGKAVHIDNIGDGQVYLSMNHEGHEEHEKELATASPIPYHGEAIAKPDDPGSLVSDPLASAILAENPMFETKVTHSGTIQSPEGKVEIIGDQLSVTGEIKSGNGTVVLESSGFIIQDESELSNHSTRNSDPTLEELTTSSMHSETITGFLQDNRDLIVRTRIGLNSENEGNVIIDSPIVAPQDTNSLTIEAHNDIILNANIDFEMNNSAGNLTLKADGVESDGLGAIINGGGTIKMETGEFILSAATGIGSVGSPLAIEASILDARNSVSGGIFIHNSGSLSLTDLNQDGFSLHANGDNSEIDLNPGGSLKVNASIVAGASIKISGDQVIQINGANLSTTSSTNGTIDLANSPIEIDEGAVSINAQESIILTGPISSPSNQDLSIQASNVVVDAIGSTTDGKIGSLTVFGDITITDDIVTTGPQRYNGKVTAEILEPSGLNFTSDNADIEADRLLVNLGIEFQSSLEPGSSFEIFTVNTGSGNITLNTDIDITGDFSLPADSSIPRLAFNFSGERIKIPNLFGASIFSGGAALVDLNLNGDTIIESISGRSLQGVNITFMGNVEGIDGDVPQDMLLMDADKVTFNGKVGAEGNIGDLTLSADRLVQNAPISVQGAIDIMVKGPLSVDHDMLATGDITIQTLGNGNLTISKNVIKIESTAGGKVSLFAADNVIIDMAENGVIRSRFGEVGSQQGTIIIIADNSVDTIETKEIQQISGSIDSVNLTLSAKGNVLLNRPNNDVDRLAVDITGSGNFDFKDKNGVIVDVVDGLSGITTESGNVILDLGGQLTIDQSITGGTSIKVLAESIENQSTILHPILINGANLKTTDSTRGKINLGPNPIEIDQGTVLMSASDEININGPIISRTHQNLELDADIISIGTIGGIKNAGNEIGTFSVNGNVKLSGNVLTVGSQTYNGSLQTESGPISLSSPEIITLNAPISTLYFNGDGGLSPNERTINFNTKRVFVIGNVFTNGPQFYNAPVSVDLTDDNVNSIILDSNNSNIVFSRKVEILFERDVENQEILEFGIDAGSGVLGFVEGIDITNRIPAISPDPIFEISIIGTEIELNDDITVKHNFEAQDVNINFEGSLTVASDAAINSEKGKLIFHGAIDGVSNDSEFPNLRINNSAVPEDRVNELTVEFNRNVGSDGNLDTIEVRSNQLIINNSLQSVNDIVLSALAEDGGELGPTPFHHTGGVISSKSGDITIIADDMDLSGNGIKVSNKTITLQSNSESNPWHLGGEGDVRSTLELSNSELEKVNTGGSGILRIGTVEAEEGLVISKIDGLTAVDNLVLSAKTIRDKSLLTETSPLNTEDLDLLNERVIPITIKDLLGSLDRDLAENPTVEVIRSDNHWRIEDQTGNFTIRMENRQLRLYEEMGSITLNDGGLALNSLENIELESPENDFGVVSATTSGGDVRIRDKNELEIGEIDQIAGVSAERLISIQKTGEITINGVTLITNNEFTGRIDFGSSPLKIQSESVEIKTDVVNRFGRGEIVIEGSINSSTNKDLTLSPGASGTVFVNSIGNIGGSEIGQLQINGPVVANREGSNATGGIRRNEIGQLQINGPVDANGEEENLDINVLQPLTIAHNMTAQGDINISVGGTELGERTPNQFQQTGGSIQSSNGSISITADDMSFGGRIEAFENIVLKSNQKSGNWVLGTADKDFQGLVINKDLASKIFISGNSGKLKIGSLEATLGIISKDVPLNLNINALGLFLEAKKLDLEINGSLGRPDKPAVLSADSLTLRGSGNSQGDSSPVWVNLSGNVKNLKFDPSNGPPSGFVVFNETIEFASPRLNHLVARLDSDVSSTQLLSNELYALRLSRSPYANIDNRTKVEVHNPDDWPSIIDIEEEIKIFAEKFHSQK